MHGGRGVGLGLVAGAAWCAPALAARVPPLAAGLGVPRRTAADRTVALTFDDGPDPHGTPAVLEVLRAHGAVATFFLVGEQVRRTGALRDEILAAGHTIAVHGDRHRNLLRLGPRAVAEDLARACDTLGPAAVAVHRPPYGIYSPVALHVARRSGLEPLLWSRWGRDWRARATPDTIAREVTRDLGSGDVLLLHDADAYSATGSWRRTAQALPRVLEAIAAAGLRTAAVTPPLLAVR